MPVIAAILIAVWAVLLPAQGPVWAPPGSRRLVEARLQSANAIQPPELVLGMLGLRPEMSAWSRANADETSGDAIPGCTGIPPAYPTDCSQRLPVK